MHSPALWFVTTIAIATLVAARPMHAGIDYQRYLAEKNDTQADLDAWRSKFGDIATKNGWMPVSEDRSIDDQEEDLRQRIFLTKQSLASAQAANPNANFSIMTPFSALTKDEFSKYVLNSYIRGNGTTHHGSGSSARRLRSDAGSAAPTGIGAGSGSSSPGINFASLISEILQIISGLKSGTVQPASDSSSTVLSEGTDSSHANYKFSDFSDFWGWPTEAPATGAPTDDGTSGSSTPASSGSAASGSVDWTTSSCVADVQNQGNCGSCWAFATVSAVESAQCIANGKTSLTKYSEQQVVSCDTQDMGCNGGAPEYALQFVQQNGLCTEQDYPYTSGDSGYADSCSTSCKASDTGLKGYSSLSGESDLVSGIDKNPVIVAVASGNDVWKQYTGGVISSCDTNQLDHAVVAVGYDSSSIKIRNSWGSSWGEEGYIRLARGTSGDGTCGVLTDMSSPQM